MIWFSGSLWLEWGLRGTQEEMNNLTGWPWIWIRVLLTGSESLICAFPYKSLFRQWEWYRCQLSWVAEIKDDMGWAIASVCLPLPSVLVMKAWGWSFDFSARIPWHPFLCFKITLAVRFQSCLSYEHACASHVCVCMHVWELMEARRMHQIPWNWKYSCGLSDMGAGNWI